MPVDRQLAFSYVCAPPNLVSRPVPLSSRNKGCFLRLIIKFGQAYGFFDEITFRLKRDEEEEEGRGG